MRISLRASAHTRIPRFWLGLLAAAGMQVLQLLHPAAATEAGWRQYTVPVSASNPEAIPVALFYPTQAPARTIAMGLFEVRAAVMAPAEAMLQRQQQPRRSSGGIILYTLPVRGCHHSIDLGVPAWSVAPNFHSWPSQNLSAQARWLIDD